jgi:hypothetical protein
MYGRLVLFAVFWYIFFHFGMYGPRKIWQPWIKQNKLNNIGLCERFNNVMT